MRIEDYFKYRVQGGDIYVLPVDVFDELFDELSNLQQENKQLSRIIDKIDKELNEQKADCIENKGFDTYTDIEIEAIEPVLHKIEVILKEVE